MTRNAFSFMCDSLVRIPTMTAIAVLTLTQTAFAARDLHQLQAKAEQGFVKEEVELASAYFNGNGVAQDPKLAAYWYQKAAEGGNPEAQNLVGYFYEVGLGVPADPARALHWYQLAAASGLPDATLNLGVLYVLGVGVEKDTSVAAQYFQEAVRKGNGTGATYMGTLNYFGIGMQQDRVAAEHWYTVGEKLHDPMAAYDLGTLYSVVPDHPHNPSKAAGYLRESAGEGYVPSMHSLAVLLVHHSELARSTDEAVNLLEFCANVGYWRSSLVLGVLARDGRGVPVDSKAAYYHFQVAMLQGNGEVRDLLSRDTQNLADMLGSEESRKLESDASQWFQQHHLAMNFINTKGNKGKLFPAQIHGDPTAVLHASLPSSDPAS
jgi:uncharacterized protein